jgi:hypothetical protein
MESKVSAIHEIDHNISRENSASATSSWWADEQVFDVLKTVAQVAEERMVQMLEHSPFSYYIPNAFGSNNWTSLSFFKASTTKMSFNSNLHPF